MTARRPLFLQPAISQSPLLGYLPLEAADTGLTLGEIKTAASEHKFETINPQAGFQAMKTPVVEPTVGPLPLLGGTAPLLPLPRLPNLPGVPAPIQPLAGLPAGFFQQARSPRLAEGAFQLATPTGPRYPPLVTPVPIRGEAIAPEAGGLGLMMGPPKFATTPRPIQPLSPTPLPVQPVPTGQLPEWQQPFRQEQPDIKIDPRTGRPLPYTNPNVFGSNPPPLPTYVPPAGPTFTVPQYGTGLGGLGPLPTLPLGRPAPLPLGTGLTPLPTVPTVQTDALREIALQIDPARLTVATARAGTDGSYSLPELQTWATALQLPRSGTKKLLVERIQGKRRELGFSD